MKRPANLRENMESLKDDSAYRSPEKAELVKLITEGAFLFNAQKHAEAKACYDKALEIDPDDPIVLSNLGAVYVELKKYDEALPLLDKSIRIKPDSSSAWYNKAAGLSMLGENEEALDCLEKAVKLDPEKIKLARKDPDFSYIRNSPRFSIIVT